MDASRNSVLFAKALVLFFVFILLAILLMKTPQTSSGARLQKERGFENAIPKDIPIDIKIKKEKEKSFRDLANEGWAREFELELTNTGNKPIYYLDILMVTDVKAADGHRIVFPLQYGRVGLGDIISKPLSEDVPIAPGDTHVFKIHPGQVPAWEKGQREENRPQPTKLRFELQTLSFGDGTGYFGNEPYPPVDRRQSRLNDGRQSSTGQPKARAWPRALQFKTSSTPDTPVTFLPANFLDAQSVKRLSLTAAAPLLDACLFVSV